MRCATLSRVGLLAIAAAARSGRRSRQHVGRGPGRVPPRGRVSPGPGSATGPTAGRCPIPGTGPYQEPVIGGTYGGYMGMAGNWARTEGCKTGNFLAWSPANAGQANTNFTKYHVGVGTGVYWYMGGPGVDPHWNGTTTEASNGASCRRRGRSRRSRASTSPTRCSGPTSSCRGSRPPRTTGGTASTPRRAAAKVRQTPSRRSSTGRCSTGSRPTSPRTPRTRSASTPPRDLAIIFGTGVRSPIPNTYEWTYLPETSSLSAAPTGWCLQARRPAPSSSAGRRRRASTR